MVENGKLLGGFFPPERKLPALATLESDGILDCSHLAAHSLNPLEDDTDV